MSKKTNHRTAWALSLAAAAMTMAVTQSANAADLPPRAAPAPVYKAPVFAPPPSWSGFYIGGNVGGIWNNTSSVSSFTTTGAVFGTGSGNSSGFAGGGQIGYNFMVSPSILLGVEVDSQWSSIKNTVTTTAGAISAERDGKFDYFGTARGRIGFVAGSALFYGTGGFAWSAGQEGRTQLVGITGAATPGTVETVDNTRTGWTAGGGIEWMFAPHWTAKAEYLYLDLGHATSTFPIAGVSDNVSLHSNVFRVGLNYLFDFGGPVVARY